MKIFDYEDVQLLPRKGVVKSRSECDTSAWLGKFKFKLPVVPANMKTVIDENLVIKLAKENYFYIMHRFNVDSFSFTKMMQEKRLIASISIGVKEDDKKIIDKFAAEKVYPDFITIDIAHGHSIAMKEMISHIKCKLKDKSFIIAGNVGTTSGVADLEEWGADATKIGVGPGKVCITKLKTGFGTGGWQLSAVNMCRKIATKPMIADGGLKVNGDIAKSIRFGASFAMIGSMLSGHDESPAKSIKIDGKMYKEYYGSASSFNKKTNTHIEGKRELVPVKGSILDTLKEMHEDVQSSISYAGGKKLDDIRKVGYVLLKNSEGY